MAASGYEEIKTRDGSAMRGYLASPQKWNGAAILVIQEVFGVNHHIRSIADRFAAEGYLAVAPELFHRTAPGFEIGYGDFAPALPHVQAMTSEGIEADLQAAAAWLEEKQKRKALPLACAGFCMGGRVAFFANTVLPLKAAISFYGGGIAATYPDKTPLLHAPVLFFWGGKDRHILREQRLQVLDSMNEHGKPFVNIEFSEADHGFFCDERESYHAASARLAWETALRFLEINLKDGRQN